MASFYGRQQTTNQGGANQAAPKTATAGSCTKNCERMLNQCYSDATNFAEKERCRDRYDVCYDKCGAIPEPNVNQPVYSPAGRPPDEGGTDGGGGGGTNPEVDRCYKKCGGYVEPCFSQCLYQAGGAEDGQPCTINQGCKSKNCVNGICQPKTQPGPGASCKDKIGQQCSNDAMCGYNGQCVGAKVDPASKTVKFGKCACKGGGNYCPNGDKDCQTGYHCVNGACVPITPGGCKDDAYCINKHGAGWTCVKAAGAERGICKKTGVGGECTPGKRCTGPEKNNSQCGGLKCFRPKGWDGKETTPGTCYCNVGPGAGEDGGGGGEYQWPSDLANLYGQITGKASDYLNMDLPDYALSPELQALLGQLLGRAGEYMARKPGYSPAALEAQFGKGYENIRNLGTLARGQTLADLQREGMLGTGAGLEALRTIPWQTEKNVSDVISDVFLANEEQKRKDLEAYTNMASGLFGQGVGVEQIVEAINAARRGEERDYTTIANQLFGSGMTYNQILESINAARRGEGQNALAMYLQYIIALMSSWKS